MFLGFQYPVEIPGVNNVYLLKAAFNAARKQRGLAEVDAFEFLGLVREKMQLMHMDDSFLSRGVNEGFSGGEKKRNEILQMLVLEPKLAILDETDSGLDIDALKVVAAGVNTLRSPERACVLVTHYQRLLEYIVPDFVHVLVRGRIAAAAIARWPSSSSGAATTGSPERRPERAMNPLCRPHRAGVRAAAAVPARRSAPPCERGCAGAPGLPATRDENWRYANLRALERRASCPPRRSRPTLLPASIPAALAGLVRFVFVDGRVGPAAVGPAHRRRRSRHARSSALSPAARTPAPTRASHSSTRPSPPPVNIRVPAAGAAGAIELLFLAAAAPTRRKLPAPRAWSWPPAQVSA